METPERVSPQATPKIDLDSSGDLFYRCPVGGFASLSPGICPKCSERLVVVSAVNGSDDARLAFGDGNHNGRSSKR